MMSRICLIYSPFIQEQAGEDLGEDVEKVWLLHPSGFSSGRLNKVKNEHGDIISQKVKLDHGGEEVDVDEGYVDKVYGILTMSLSKF